MLINSFLNDECCCEKLSKQCVHSVLKLKCSAQRGLIFHSYLNSLPLTFCFSSNCQMLKIPPYVLQTLLFWGAEYLVVCTARGK